MYRGRLAPVFHLFVAHLGTLIEAAQARFFNGRDVHEDIFATAVGLNKSKSLSRVEPLHSTCRHHRTPFLNQGSNLGRLGAVPQGKPVGLARRDDALSFIALSLLSAFSRASSFWRLEPEICR